LQCWILSFALRFSQALIIGEQRLWRNQERQAAGDFASELYKPPIYRWVSLSINPTYV